MINQNTLEQNKKAIDYWSHQSPYISYYRHTLNLSYIINLITDSGLNKDNKSSLINLYTYSLMKLIQSLYDYQHIQNYSVCTKIIKQMFYVGNNNTDELNEIIEVCKSTHPMDRNMPNVYMENLAKQYESIIIVIFGKIYIKNIESLCSSLANMNTNCFIIDLDDKGYMKKTISFYDFWNGAIEALYRCNIVLDFYNQNNKNIEWGQSNIELIEKKIKKSETVKYLDNVLYIITKNTSRNNFPNDISNTILKIKIKLSQLIKLYSSNGGQALNHDILGDLYTKIDKNQEEIQHLQKFLLHHYKPTDQ